MKVEQVVCDECRRIRGESNHWHKIGILVIKSDCVQLTLGVVPDPGKVEMQNYSVHDICGEECFHKHIDRLLGKTRIEAAPAEPPPFPKPDIPFIENVGGEYTGI